MREQLKNYVDLLFAGAPDSKDMKEEILQNTLDRYDDLIAQGKAPAAAYSLAISGIGDINEVLIPTQEMQQDVPVEPAPEKVNTPFWKKLLRAVSIFLYILCPIPLIVLEALDMETIGLCGLLSLVAVATVLMVLSGGSKHANIETKTQESALSKAVGSIIFTIGLCGYLALSFATGAWHVTWIIFLIMAAVNSLSKAIIDLCGGTEK